jgi:protein Mpv17
VLTKIKTPNKHLDTVTRVLADQIIFASTNLAFFLSSMAYLEGSSVSEKLSSTYVEALKKNWMVWPAVQAVNFTVVPLQHRVLVVNVVSLGWNCYLSYVNSRGGKDPKKGDEMEGTIKEKIGTQA